MTKEMIDQAGLKAAAEAAAAYYNGKRIGAHRHYNSCRIIIAAYEAAKFAALPQDAMERLAKVIDPPAFYPMSGNNQKAQERRYIARERAQLAITIMGDAHYSGSIERESHVAPETVSPATSPCHAEEMKAMLGHVLESHRLKLGDSHAGLSGTLDQVEALLSRLEALP